MATENSIQHAAEADRALRQTDRAGQERYWNPYWAGAALGLLLFVSFMLSGHGIGASGGLAHLLAALEDLIVPHHVDANPSLAEMAGGAANPLNNWVVFQVLGTLIGGFVSGLLAGRVRPALERGPQTSVKSRISYALLGGALVGFGARMARGCTSGQALSGGAVLSAGSWAFMFAVFAGGYLLAWPVRRLWN